MGFCADPAACRLPIGNGAGAGRPGIRPQKDKDMSKRFNDYTDAELLGIDNETLNISIRVEAIQRGVKPPIPISEALRRSEWRGYEKPAEAIKVYRLRQGYYTTDFGWLDEAKAQAALEGVVKIEKVNYKDDHLKICTPDVAVETVWVGVNKGEQKAAKFEEFFEDTTDFDKVRDECLDRLSRVRQEAYDAKVRTEKRAEYLRLAAGDEAIARAFWARVEGGEWPEA